MKEILGNNIERQEKPIISVVDWIENKEWEKDAQIMSRVNETTAYLKSISSEDAGYTFGTPFDALFVMGFLESNDNHKIIEEKVRDKVVIDLGAGSAYRLLEEFAKLNVKEYIGVDKKRSDSIISDYAKQRLGELGVKGDYIRSDMLLFVSKLPDKSANFVINGIDDNILDNKEYWDRLIDQIYRTTYDEGVIMGTGSEFNLFTKKFVQINEPIRNEWNVSEGIFKKR